MEIRLLGKADRSVLERVAPEVFDHPIRDDSTTDFLSDARHHLAVAVEEGVVIGMASAVHYVHPDKGPELWVNEIGVTPTHRRRGIAKGLLQALSEKGRQLGCEEAWVLTERSNGPARALYAEIGATESADDTVLFAWRLEPGEE